MAIRQDYIDRVLGATSIVDVVGEYVKLKKVHSGKEFVGLCPFHGESTPSFSVNAEKRVFLCRGCGEKGNAAQFLTKHVGLSFPQAVSRLAERAGLPPPESSRFELEEDRLKAELIGIVRRAGDLYRQALADSPQAIAYLRKRGVDRETQERFGIGFAPGGGKLLTTMMKDVDPALLRKAGLVYESKYGQGGQVDWMNYRVVFPIRNSSGNTIAFGGRSLSERPNRKYLNSPETLIFKKTSELFGLTDAATSIRKGNSVIVTEGYLDVVVPSGRGVGNIVSAMGTALSQGSIQRLFRMADEVVFCFDGDDAGRSAAMRSLITAAPILTERHSAKFAFLPEGMDPDDFVMQKGPDAFREFVSGALPMSRYIVKEFSAKNDMSSVEGRARFASDSMEVVAQLGSPTLRGLMAQEVAKVVGPDIPLPKLPVTNDSPSLAQLSSVPSLSPYSQSSAGGSSRRSEMASSADSGGRPGSPTGLAVRVMALFLRDPYAGQFFEPDWLQYVDTSPSDIEAIRAAVEIVKEEPEIERDALARALSTGPGYDLMERAQRLDEQTLNLNPADQLAGIVQFLERYAERASRLKAVRSRM
jgi:DNA primase